jgi:hypothetical protein
VNREQEQHDGEGKRPAFEPIGECADAAIRIEKKMSMLAAAGISKISLSRRSPMKDRNKNASTMEIAEKWWRLKMVSINSAV